jgi:hypothetical protein
MKTTIIARAYAAFQADYESTPELSLRGGNALDSYDEPPAYDPALDAPTDEYLAQHTFWGLGYLDAASWRHYLPQLIDYSIRHIAVPGTMAIEGVLWSLRPPDRVPPRLGSLNAEQEAVIVEFLELLAFNEQASAYHDFAMQILDEWWLPNARYRDRKDQN